MRLRIAMYDAFALFEGSGRAALDIAERLNVGRFEAVFVSPREGDLLTAVRARGYEAAVVEPPGVLRRYNKAILRQTKIALPALGLSLLQYGVRLGRWLRAHRVDLLHCNQTRAVLQAGLAGKFAGIPVVWVARIREPLPRLATLWGAWCASAVVSLAPGCLEEFKGAQVLASKIADIPLGVDTERFAPPEENPPVPHGLGVRPRDRVVVMVGGLHPRKRHDLLIDAAPRIIAAVPEVRLVIVGGVFEDVGPEYETQLKERAHHLGVAERVIFAGRRDDVPAILRIAEVFVLPSDREGLPGAVLEAMATGLPCVVTRVAAAPVVDGVTGSVIPPNDADALANAVVRLLRDQGLRVAMGRAARQRAVEVYSLQATVRQYEALYSSLVSRKA